MRVISSVDINTLISFDTLLPQLYYCEGCINFPWSNGWLLCLPNAIGNNKSSKQIALRHGTNDVNNFNTQVRNYYNSGKVWSNWYSYITNADLDGHLYITPGGNMALEAAVNGSTTRYRLQLNNTGDVLIFWSTDGGKTWPSSKKIASYS